MVGTLTRRRILVGLDELGLTSNSEARATVSKLSLRVLELRRVGSDGFGDSVGGCLGAAAGPVLGDGFGALLNDFLELDLVAGVGALAEAGRGVDAVFGVPLMLIGVLVRRSFWFGAVCIPFRAPRVIRFVLRGSNSTGSALVRPDLRFPSSMKVVGPSASIFFQGGDSTLDRRMGLGGVVSRTRRLFAGGSSSWAS